jgi:hypothetical protein
MGRAMESVERLADLKARWACSGHGPAILEPERALAAARERYEGWLERPESAAWHACKRIAAYSLMIRDGLAEVEATDHFASRPWAADFARHAFEADPREFARALIEELLRSGAARRRGGRLVASVPHNRPRQSGTPPIPGPETGRLLKRRRNGPMGTVARIVETTGKEKDEQARGPADQLFRWALRR